MLYQNSYKLSSCEEGNPTVDHQGVKFGFKYRPPPLDAARKGPIQRIRIVYTRLLRLFNWKSWRNIMITLLLVIWLRAKRRILCAITTSGQTRTNKWTYTVLPASFVEELEWSVASNWRSFSLFFSPRRYETFALFTLLLGYQKVLYTEVRTTPSLWLWITSPKFVTIYHSAQTWQQENWQKSLYNKSYDCMKYIQ